MAYGPKDWHPRGEAYGLDAKARKFESAVREAFVQVYGLPRILETVARSIRSSFLPDGEKLGWTAPNEDTVLVLTEYAWVQDPWSPDIREHQKWQKVIDLLRANGWPNSWWDSVNPAVHVVYTE